MYDFKKRDGGKFSIGDVLQHVMSYEFEALPFFSLIS
jgi:hypothetical protein